MVTSPTSSPASRAGLLDHFAQAVLGNGGQEVALAVAVVDGLQARQPLVAVEEVCAHGADQEQRAFRILQGVGEQRIEGLARARRRRR